MKRSKKKKKIESEKVLKSKSIQFKIKQQMMKNLNTHHVISWILFVFIPSLVKYEWKPIGTNQDMFGNASPIFFTAFTSKWS